MDSDKSVLTCFLTSFNQPDLCHSRFNCRKYFQVFHVSGRKICPLRDPFQEDLEAQNLIIYK